MSTPLDTGEVSTDLYLSAVVVLLSKDAPGGQVELMQNILDGKSTAQIGKGRWRRFYTDNATILVVCTGDESGILVQPEVKLTPDAVREAVHYLVDGSRQWKPDSWMAHDVSFMISGVAGLLIECWTARHCRTSPILICPECKEFYDLSSDAGIVTPDLVRKELVKRGNNVWIVRDQDSAPPIPKDLIYRYPTEITVHPEQFIRSLRQVLLDLQHENPRRWCCAQNHVHGYPGSFSRHVFAHINIQPQQ